MSVSESIHPSRLRFDPKLMEEAVMLYMKDHPSEREFRYARNKIYELHGEDNRDRYFNRIHRDWFTRMNLGQPIIQALNERPLLMREIRDCRTGYAVFPKDEGADLYGDTPMTIVLKLRPTSFLDISTLLVFLRHEFTHLCDMLDPCFNYEPELPKSEAGPPHDNLIRERYRVLWDTWIDGRLLHQGWVPEEVKTRRLAEFKAAFPMLKKLLHTKFLEWFDSPVHTHQELVAFALNPGIDSTQISQQPLTNRCPLCSFPSPDLQNGQDLPGWAVKEIVLDFPDWQTCHGLCQQCADLYKSRQLSKQAEAALPGN